MDNFEDNCVENKQNLEAQSPQWITTWAEYILKQSSTTSKLNEDSIKLIEHILLATLQGDSCFAKGQYSVALLDSLILNEQQALSAVAPFVVDEHYFYLYRYWKLEQRLALQIQRLVQQDIESIDIQVFEHLLEDEHQKAALKMVAAHALNIITGGLGQARPIL